MEMFVPVVQVRKLMLSEMVSLVSKGIETVIQPQTGDPFLEPSSLCCWEARHVGVRGERT